MVRTTTTSLLLSLCLLPWFLTGCSDELLPPQPPQADESARTFYVIDRQSPGVYPIRTDGTREERISLPGYLLSPVSRNNRAAVVPEENSNQITVVDLTTGAPVATLNEPEGREISPYSAAISPDGRRIGFSVQEIVGLSVNSELHLVDVDGKNRTIVDVAPGGGQMLRFSPDGSQVAFFDGYTYDIGAGGFDRSGTLYVVSTSNGAKKKLIETERLESDGSVDIKWSPDGKSILYGVGGEDRGAWLVDVATGQQTRLHDEYSQFDWSEDGETILLTTFADLLVYEREKLDTPRSTGVLKPILLPHLLPGGREVVGYLVTKELDQFEVETDPADLVRISLETGEVTVIAPQQDVWFLFIAPPVE